MPTSPADQVKFRPDNKLYNFTKSLVVLFITTLAFSISFSVNTLFEIFLSEKSPNFKIGVHTGFIIASVVVILLLGYFLEFDLS